MALYAIFKLVCIEIMILEICFSNLICFTLRLFGKISIIEPSQAFFFKPKPSSSIGLIQNFKLQARKSLLKIAQAEPSPQAEPGSIHLY